MWGLPQRQGSIQWSTLMCPVNSQNEEKLSQYAVSPAHGRGGSQDEVKLAYYALRTLPRPRARWLAGRGENFTSTPSVYSSSLPCLERLSYSLEYISFNRFQYELLVHTPNTDVYRRILECRFTHFAPYVVHIETWTCSNSFGLIQPERYILQYHYCSTSRRSEEPIARLIVWRCQAQGLQENEQQVPRHL